MTFGESIPVFGLMPIVGPLVLLYGFVQPGGQGTNAWGDPAGETADAPR